VGGFRECKASTSLLTSAIVWFQSSRFGGVVEPEAGVVAMATGRIHYFELESMVVVVGLFN
jgi:hypothetical protein